MWSKNTQAGKWSENRLHHAGELGCWLFGWRLFGWRLVILAVVSFSSYCLLASVMKKSNLSDFLQTSEYQFQDLGKILTN
jgi:hypothetical protein